MKKDIIGTLKDAINFADSSFNNKEQYSHAYLIGYLQGTMKTVIGFLEQEDIEVNLTQKKHGNEKV